MAGAPVGAGEPFRTIMERDTRAGRLPLIKQYYLITKNGLLDVNSMLIEETREAVLTNLQKLMDESYGKLSSQPAQLAFVQRKDVESLNHETVMGFDRFFSRHDTEHAVIIQWTEDGELFPYLLGDGRLMNFEDGLGLIPRESVLSVRDDLLGIVAGNAEVSGKGRLLYIPLRTLAGREDMQKTAKDIFATVLSDNGYEMIGMLEWTGGKLADRLIVT